MQKDQTVRKRRQDKCKTVKWPEEEVLVSMLPTQWV
jgi:hypothetical protein